MKEYIKELNDVLLTVTIMDESRFWMMVVAVILIILAWRLPNILSAWRKPEK